MNAGNTPHAPRTGEKSPNRNARFAVVASWAAVVVMLALIFWMSAKTGADLDENSGLVSTVKAWLASTAVRIVGHPIDISPIGHFTEYLVLGALLFNALRWHLPLPRAAWIAPLLASLYGITDEFHQIFVPSRSCDPADWLVDTVAAIIGALIAFAFLRKKGKQG